MLRLSFLEAPGHSAEAGQGAGGRGHGETASKSLHGAGADGCPEPGTGC